MYGTIDDLIDDIQIYHAAKVDKILISNFENIIHFPIPTEILAPVLDQELLSTFNKVSYMYDFLHIRPCHL